MVQGCLLEHLWIERHSRLILIPPTAATVVIRHWPFANGEAQMRLIRGTPRAPWRRRTMKHPNDARLCVVTWKTPCSHHELDFHGEHLSRPESVLVTGNGRVFVSDHEVGVLELGCPVALWSAHRKILCRTALRSWKAASF